MLDFLVLAHECAPTISPQTLAAVVSVESSHNPYAIGIVGGKLEKQPTDKYAAQLIVHDLLKADKNFSVGIAQINRYNLPKYNLSYNDAFDACKNLEVAAKILEDCYSRSYAINHDEQTALRESFSCYYSGNFERGFKPDAIGQPSYVQKVVAQADKPVPLQIVPPIKVNAVTKDDAAPVLVKVPEENTGSEKAVVETNPDEDKPQESQVVSSTTIVF